VTGSRPSLPLRQDSTGYEVRLPAFEGPLDLLLHLIRSQRVEIRDIPIAQIAEQYHAAVTRMEALGELDLARAGEFLLLAATLMEIKSRSLLPRPAPVSGEDPEAMADPREELAARLLEYERYRQLAEALRSLADTTSRSFPRAAADSWAGSLPLTELRPDDLAAALTRLCRPDEPALRDVMRVRRRLVSVERYVERLVTALNGLLPGAMLAFSLYYRSECTGRAEVLAAFLAVLEIVRLGRASAWQDAAGEIYLALPRTTAPGNAVRET
jgi:segregation and condensation protein A